MVSELHVFDAGVLHSITQPLVMGDKVVAGVSVAFKIGAENTGKSMG